MEIKVKTSTAIDFSSFMDELQEKYQFNYRDMAGKYSKEADQERQAKIDMWLTTNGLLDKKYVLNKPVGSREDWPKDSEEMKTRIDINTRMPNYYDDEDRPYLDVWHYFLDNDFYDFQKGTYHNYLDVSRDRIDNGSDPEYVKVVLRAIRTEVENHPTFNSAAEEIQFYIDW